MKTSQAPIDELPCREPQSARDPVRETSEIVTSGDLVRPVASAADIVEAHKAVVELIEKALTPEEDFGAILGTSGKPVLLKPGAERLTIAFGARPEFDVVEREIDHDREVKWSKRRWEWGQRRGEKVWSTENGESQGLYRYVIRCRLLRPDGRVIGEGIGACSSMESRHIQAPRDSENTILKMAKKRAHVDAVLTMAGLSNRFTQDAEDMPREQVPAVPVDAPQFPDMGTRQQAAKIWGELVPALEWQQVEAERWLTDRIGNHRVSQVPRGKVSEAIDDLMAMLAKDVGTP